MTPSTAKPGTNDTQQTTEPPSRLPEQPEATRLSEPRARSWQILCGLVVSGLLLALPGGLLPLWGYHIHPEYGTAGNYFMMLGVGIMGGGAVALRLARWVRLERLLTAGYLIAAAGMILLSFAAPPAQVWYQMTGFALTGAAAGTLNCAVLEALTSWYNSNPARAVLIGGIFFGGGNALSALLLAGSFEDGSVTWLLALAGVLTAAGGLSLAPLRIKRRDLTKISLTQSMLGQSMKDLRSPLAILFALLLFFQFGNEWSIAGWMPVYLIDRMGVSPATAVTLLAFYWLALVAGRMVTSKLLRRVRHWRLLGISAFCALFGCTALLVAGSRFGAIAGLLMTGGGFSAIYPLVAERISRRFSYYHPGYFNGIFTFALMGGLLTPFALGHVAADLSLRVVPLAALTGSCAVFALVLLIWLGSKVSGH